MRPIIRGVIFGIITITAYLGVVIVTTPALPPEAAISAAFQLNSIVIMDESWSWLANVSCCRK